MLKKLLFLPVLFSLLFLLSVKLNADFVSFFGEFCGGGIVSNLAAAQNAEIDDYNRTFSENGWSGSFKRIWGLGALGVNIGLIFDAGILGNIGFYMKYENINMNSYVDDVEVNTVSVEKVYYPTGELAASNEHHFVLNYSAIGFRKYWLGPWESVFVNFFTGLDIGLVYGGTDMVDIKRTVYNTDGSVLEDKSRNMAGGFFGVCFEAGFIIPSNFGIGFEFKTGYMAAMGIVMGTDVEILDISGMYFKAGIAVDFIEDYKKLKKKKEPETAG